jgi:hypothetical protein
MDQFKKMVLGDFAHSGTDITEGDLIDPLRPHRTSHASGDVLKQLLLDYPGGMAEDDILLQLKIRDPASSEEPEWEGLIRKRLRTRKDIVNVSNGQDDKFQLVAMQRAYREGSLSQEDDPKMTASNLSSANLVPGRSRMTTSRRPAARRMAPVQIKDSSSVPVPSVPSDDPAEIMRRRGAQDVFRRASKLNLDKSVRVPSVTLKSERRRLEYLFQTIVKEITSYRRKTSQILRTRHAQIESHANTLLDGISEAIASSWQEFRRTWQTRHRQIENHAATLLAKIVADIDSCHQEFRQILEPRQSLISRAATFVAKSKAEIASYQQEFLQTQQTRDHEIASLKYRGAVAMRRNADALSDLMYAHKLDAHSLRENAKPFHKFVYELRQDQFIRGLGSSKRFSEFPKLTLMMRHMSENLFDLSTEVHMCRNNIWLRRSYDIDPVFSRSLFFDYRLRQLRDEIVDLGGSIGVTIGDLWLLRSHRIRSAIQSRSPDKSLFPVRLRPGYVLRQLRLANSEVLAIFNMALRISRGGLHARNSFGNDVVAQALGPAELFFQQLTEFRRAYWSTIESIAVRTSRGHTTSIVDCLFQMRRDRDDIRLLLYEAKVRVRSQAQYLLLCSEINRTCGIEATPRERISLPLDTESTRSLVRREANVFVHNVPFTALPQRGANPSHLSLPWPETEGSHAQGFKIPFICASTPFTIEKGVLDIRRRGCCVLGVDAVIDFIDHGGVQQPLVRRLVLATESTVMNISIAAWDMCRHLDIETSSVLRSFQFTGQLPHLVSLLEDPEVRKVGADTTPIISFLEERFGVNMQGCIDLPANKRHNKQTQDITAPLVRALAAEDPGISLWHEDTSNVVQSMAAQCMRSYAVLKIYRNRYGFDKFRDGAAIAMVSALGPENQLRLRFSSITFDESPKPFLVPLLDRFTPGSSAEELKALLKSRSRTPEKRAACAWKVHAVLGRHLDDWWKDLQIGLFSRSSRQADAMYQALLAKQTFPLRRWYRKILSMMVWEPSNISEYRSLVRTYSRSPKAAPKRHVRLRGNRRHPIAHLGSHEDAMSRSELVDIFGFGPEVDDLVDVSGFGHDHQSVQSQSEHPGSASTVSPNGTVESATEVQAVQTAKSETDEITARALERLESHLKSLAEKRQKRLLARELIRAKRNQAREGIRNGEKASLSQGGMRKQLRGKRTSESVTRRGSPSKTAKDVIHGGEKTAENVIRRVSSLKTPEGVSKGEGKTSESVTQRGSSSKTPKGVIRRVGSGRKISYYRSSGRDQRTVCLATCTGTSDDAG